MGKRSKSVKRASKLRRARRVVLHRMVGRTGTFVAANGVEYACIIRGTDEPPWDNLCYLIDYVRDQRLVTNAMIAVADFRPDKAAWDKQQRANRSMETNATAIY